MEIMLKLFKIIKIYIGKLWIQIRVDSFILKLLLLLLLSYFILRSLIFFYDYYFNINNIYFFLSENDNDFINKNKEGEEEETVWYKTIWGVATIVGFVVILIFILGIFFGGGSKGESSNNMNDTNTVTPTFDTPKVDYEIKSFNDYNAKSEIGFFDRSLYTSDENFTNYISHSHDITCNNMPEGTQCGLILSILFFFFYYKTLLLTSLAFYFPDTFVTYMEYTEFINKLINNEIFEISDTFQESTKNLKKINNALFIVLKEYIFEHYSEINRYLQEKKELNEILSVIWSDVEEYKEILDKQHEYLNKQEAFDKYIWEALKHEKVIKEINKEKTGIILKDFLIYHVIFNKNKYVSNSKVITNKVIDLNKKLADILNNKNFNYQFCEDDIMLLLKFAENFNNIIYYEFFIKMLKICSTKKDLESIDKFTYIFLHKLNKDVGYFSKEGILKNRNISNFHIQSVNILLHLHYLENFKLVFKNINEILESEIEEGTSYFLNEFNMYFYHFYKYHDLKYFIEMFAIIEKDSYIETLRAINEKFFDKI